MEPKENEHYGVTDMDGKKKQLTLVAPLCTCIGFLQWVYDFISTTDLIHIVKRWIEKYGIEVTDCFDRTRVQVNAA